MGPDRQHQTLVINLLVGLRLEELIIQQIGLECGPVPSLLPAHTKTARPQIRPRARLFWIPEGGDLSTRSLIAAAVRAQKPLPDSPQCGQPAASDFPCSFWVISSVIKELPGEFLTEVGVLPKGGHIYLASSVSKNKIWWQRKGLSTPCKVLDVSAVRSRMANNSYINHQTTK